MNKSIHAHTIVTGDDPRTMAEFSTMREEINKSSHPSQPEMDWRQVESLALSIFKTNGVDLHTAAYFTLARTRLQGLAGFCEGVELLAAMLNHEWDTFWPRNESARTEMLDWLNARIGNILRHQLTYSEADLPLLHRVEGALQMICDKLQQVELKKSPRVENLLYLVQNIRKRNEPKPKSQVVNNNEKMPIHTLVYVPESTQTTPLFEPPLPELPEANVVVSQGIASPEITKNFRRNSALKGFATGLFISSAIAAAAWWWKIYPLQQQIAAAQNLSQGAASLWLASPQLRSYPQHLQNLVHTPSIQNLNLGLQMVEMANSRWPDNALQQKASEGWMSLIKGRAASSPQMQGWQQTRKDLRSFSELLIQREQAKEGVTLSSIKTVTYQAERLLDQEIPLEYMLTQYQQDQSAGKSTEILAKQISERIDGLLSRWMLLRHSPVTD